MSRHGAARARIEAVVLGASAGGVEALSVLLPALPADFALPVFVVLHLPRHRPSMLVDIFTHKCALPVREAEDKEAVAPGTIYFAPPDYHLLIDRGPQLALSMDEPVFFSRPSIDVLFASAADVYGAGLLGAVLTGANEDGAAGLEAVCEAGGTTLVQRPETALARGMPEAALRRCAPDAVLELPEMAALLKRLPSIDIQRRK